MSQVPTMLRDHLLLADTPNAASWARHQTHDVLGRWRVPPDQIDTVLLVVSNSWATPPSIRTVRSSRRG